MSLGVRCVWDRGIVRKQMWHCTLLVGITIRRQEGGVGVRNEARVKAWGVRRFITQRIRRRRKETCAEIACWGMFNTAAQHTSKSYFQAHYRCRVQKTINISQNEWIVTFRWHLNSSFFEILEYLYILWICVHIVSCGIKILENSAAGSKSETELSYGAQNPVHWPPMHRGRCPI